MVTMPAPTHARTSSAGLDRPSDAVV